MKMPGSRVVENGEPFRKIVGCDELREACRKERRGDFWKLAILVIGLILSSLTFVWQQESETKAIDAVQTERISALTTIAKKNDEGIESLRKMAVDNQQLNRQVLDGMNSLLGQRDDPARGIWGSNNAGGD